MKKLWLGCLVTLTATSAFAQTRSVPQIDPNVTRALVTGLAGPFSRGAPGKATVLIELQIPANPDVLSRIQRAGALLAAPEGKILAYDRFVPADVTPTSLAALAKIPEVKRVTLASARGPLPLDQSAKLMRLADARGSRPDLDELDGDGVLIADIDSLVDPFQPAFFKGDAGYYDWIDRDGDGVFTPGKDAIDLNQDGTGDASEIAELIETKQVDYYGKDTGARASDAFDPSTDFLYIDTNGNGARDFGAANGFDDTTPAFGEPLFVPDDVNRNGKLDVGERVVRLGTSKFRKIYVNLDYPPYEANHVFVRGTDLSATQVDYSHGALEGFPDAFHATGVNTILVGDVPLVGRRWVGIAPNADVDVAWDVEQTGQGLPVKGLTWALEDQPDVGLFELAVWTSVALDGSDALSTMIDTAVGKGSFTATCPTGDQGSALKHAHVDLAASAQTSMPFDLPAQTKSGQGPLTYVEITMNVRGGTPQAMTLTGPNGESADMTLAMITPITLSTGDEAYATSQKTTRGTLLYDVILYVDSTQNDPPFPTGTWNVNVTGDASNALSVDGYVADDKSSWAVGAAWDESIATNASTIGAPSTADHCIAVNAAPDHVATSNEPWYDLNFYSEYDVPTGYEETQGQVRAYSPRGPRIDGTTKPDITAPDNPWVANEWMSTLAYPYGSYSVFGGTSGASPHATGTAALLAQAGVHGDDARDAIRAGAIVDSDTGAVPNGDYGYGRLSAAGALGASAVGVDPSVAIQVAQPTYVGVALSLTPVAQSNDGDDGALQAKWDDGYDGSWDTTYAPIAAHAFTPTQIGKYPFKVRVRNSTGHVAEAVAWVDVEDAPPPETSSGCGCNTIETRADFGYAGALVALAAFARRRRR